MTLSDSLRHHRHLVELGSLLATAGAADAFADEFGTRRHGISILIGLGVALILTTVGHHLWLRRSDHAPPATGAPARAELPVATGSAGDAAGSVVWRVRTEIDNTPGRLAVLAGALAAAGVNIHGLDAQPAGAGVVVDEFLVETPAETSARHLAAAVLAVGGRSTVAVPTDLLALVDAPTRALELAARLARRPDSLAAVLADLLEAERVTVHPPGECAPVPVVSKTPEGQDPETRLMLRGLGGETVIVHRPGLPFTEVEHARARAVLDLAAAQAACAERAARGTAAGRD